MSVGPFLINELLLSPPLTVRRAGDEMQCLMRMPCLSARRDVISEFKVYHANWATPDLTAFVLKKCLTMHDITEVCFAQVRDDDGDEDTAGWSLRSSLICGLITAAIHDI